MSGNGGPTSTNAVTTTGDPPYELASIGPSNHMASTIGSLPSDGRAGEIDNQDIQQRSELKQQRLSQSCLRTTSGGRGGGRGNGLQMNSIQASHRNALDMAKLVTPGKVVTTSASKKTLGKTKLLATNTASKIKATGTLTKASSSKTKAKTKLQTRKSRNQRPNVQQGEEENGTETSEEEDDLFSDKNGWDDDLDMSELEKFINEEQPKNDFVPASTLLQASGEKENVPGSFTSKFHDGIATGKEILASFMRGPKTTQPETATPKNVMNQDATKMNYAKNTDTINEYDQEWNNNSTTQRISDKNDSRTDTTSSRIC